MKHISLIILAALLSVSVYSQTTDQVIRLSEPVISTDQYEVFGEEIEVNSLEPSHLAEVIEKESNGSIVTLTVSIAEVCNKKGCFFVAEDGEYSARITFKDYGFFIPTNSAGKEVTLVGEFSEATLSEEKAKHYAEDAGKNSDEISGEQKEYSIVATSVVIPK
ncbi:MAG: DUF4920 domain-containing protein [Balneola sp.]|nr:MAG: DUF4920 domain-containing protein [Balneola sp.]